MRILVRRARQLLTLRDGLGIIRDGAVLIRGRIIEAVGTTRRVEKLPTARRARVIDAAGRVVLPGFVDSHTHLVFGPPRLTDYEMRLAGANYSDIAAAGGGILSSVRGVRSMSAARMRTQAHAFLDAMARHGTTTVEAKSGYGLDERAELRTLRVYSELGCISTYLGAHVTPPEYSPDEYIDWMCSRMMPRVGKLARFADIYCDTGAFTLEQARRYLTCARAHGMLLKLHAEQFAHAGAAKLAVELDAVSADHLEQADTEDIAALANSSTVATLLPGSVFHLGRGRYAPARALIDAGATVALATDFNPGTSPTYNMQMILSLACTEMRMTPAEAIMAATIHGARALLCEHLVGSIEPGKQADLLMMNLSDYREIPYYFGTNNVHLTIQHGAVIQ